MNTATEELTSQATPETQPAAQTAAPKPSDDVLYFQKVIINMPFYINRVPVKFEQLDRNTGVLKIAADDPTAQALMAASLAKKGGIVLIDEAGYLELKKKLPFKPLELRSLKPKLQILQTAPPRKAKPGVAPAAVVNNPFSGRASGVSSVGVGGAGAGAGTSAPVPTPSPAGPGEFQPALGKKKVVMPVLRKPTGNSLSGGIAEPEPTG